MGCRCYTRPTHFTRPFSVRNFYLWDYHCKAEKDMRPPYHYNRESFAGKILNKNMYCHKIMNNINIMIVSSLNGALTWIYWKIQDLYDAWFIYTATQADFRHAMYFHGNRLAVRFLYVTRQLLPRLRGKGQLSTFLVSTYSILANVQQYFSTYNYHVSNDISLHKRTTRKALWRTVRYRI